MSLLRPTSAAVAVGTVLVCSLLGGCPDGRSPHPPPRVPQPKVDPEPVDPIKTGPAPRTQTVQQA